MFFPKNEHGEKNYRRSQTEKSKNKKEMQQKLKKTKKVAPLPRNIVESIPYAGVTTEGIFDLGNNNFSKSYLLPDINFLSLDMSGQEEVSELYSRFLLSFSKDFQIQITLYNRVRNAAKNRDQILIPSRGDKLDKYRAIFNDEVLIPNIEESSDEIDTLKILTVTVQAKNVKEAISKFRMADEYYRDFISQLKVDSVDHAIHPLSSEERLEILHSIYNGNSSQLLQERKEKDGNVTKAFSLEGCERQGITTKEAIAPSYLFFSPLDAQVGDLVCKSFVITSFPSSIFANILTRFSEVMTNMLVSAYFKPLDVKSSWKKATAQQTDILAEISTEQQKSAFRGYGALSPQRQREKDDIDSVVYDIQKNNSKLFETEIIITLFAKNREELERLVEQLQTKADFSMVQLRVAAGLQEIALNSALPLGNRQLDISRYMTDRSIVAMTPFDSKRIHHNGGFFYGQNSLSKSLILYDRLKEMNSSACILGAPGAGKSFKAKEELIQALLKTEDEIYVVDPEREYTIIADTFRKNAGIGQVIKLANGSTAHINPLDINLESSGDDGDPIKTKIGYIFSILSLMIGGGRELNATEESVIDEAIRNILEPFIEQLRRSGKRQDPARNPTLTDLYYELNKQRIIGPQIALSLKKYISGSENLFAHRTNISFDTRFVVFDIKDLTGNLRTIGLRVAFDHIWNHMIENFHNNRCTRMYFDEAHLLVDNRFSAEYIEQLWRRARKWLGVPTAMTQNVEDLLSNKYSRVLLANSNFRILLRQSDVSRGLLTKEIGLSDADQRWISDKRSGVGLMQVGGEEWIPFQERFPRDNELYKIMTTKQGERLYQE